MSTRPNHPYPCILPVDDGAAVLTKAAELYAAELAENPPGSLNFLDLSEKGLAKDRQKSGWRHRNAVMRWKAFVAFRFIRTIRNNHHPKVAPKMLFEDYPLADYIDHLSRANQRSG
jgi:hypothetical protein